MHARTLFYATATSQHLSLWNTSHDPIIFRRRCEIRPAVTRNLVAAALVVSPVAKNSATFGKPPISRIDHRPISARRSHRPTQSHRRDSLASMRKRANLFPETKFSPLAMLHTARTPQFATSNTVRPRQDSPTFTRVNHRIQGSSLPLGVKTTPGIQRL